MLIGRWCPHHSLRQRRAGWRIFCFVLFFQNINKSLGLKSWRVLNRVSRDHFPPPLSPSSGRLPKSTPPAHSWNHVRAVALKSPLSSRHMPGCPQASSQAPVLPPTQGGIDECYTTHPDPTPLSLQARPSQATGRVPVFHFAAPVGVSRSLASASPVRLGGSYGPSDSTTRFSSPGLTPSSGASGSLQSRPSMPLFCMWKSQSCW